MTPEEASGLSCISFDSVEFAWAFAELVFNTHERLAKNGKCFNPTSRHEESYFNEKIGRIYSVVDSVFGTHFGQTPDERFNGDFFLQVAMFCDHLANDHIFPDGNKRTALIMSSGVLHLQGVQFVFFDSSEPDRNEAYRLITDVVAGNVGVSKMAPAFMKYCCFE